MAWTRIVIVTDDDEDIRDCVAELLQDEGIDARVARHGRAALDMLEQLGDDRCVLLLDLMMPTMSGLDVLEHLERAGRLPALPVIVFTASKGYDRIDGVRHVIHKPFVMETLLRLLEEVCAPPTSQVTLRAGVARVDDASTATSAAARAG
jgi:CheY-like chemotaxis protein